MDIRNLFYLSYWFDQPRILRGTAFSIWLWSFLGLVFFGLLALFISSRHNLLPQKKFFGRAASCFLGLGLSALIWLWLRQERVNFLAWRFWLLLWLAVFVVWVIKLARYALFRLPKIRQEQNAKAASEKYLG